MKVEKFVKKHYSSIVPTNIRTDRYQKIMARRFIRMFVYTLLEREINFQHSVAKPDEIKDSKENDVKNRVKTEISKVIALQTKIWDRVKADNVLLALDQMDRIIIRSAVKSIPHIPRISKVKHLKRWRKHIVQSIVWEVLADEPKLISISQTDPNAKKLNSLVDRRMRAIERMFYQVGSVPKRKWNKNVITNNPSGPWKDGWKRFVEYPRLYGNWLGTLCNRGNSLVCSGASMIGWSYSPDAKNYSTMSRINTTVRNAWELSTTVKNSFILKSGQDPIQSIEKLFTLKESFQDRNLLYCDRVLHILLVEALIFSQKKYASNPSWLTDEINNSGEGSKYISITYPNKSGKFLGGWSNQSDHFDLRKSPFDRPVRKSDLHVGDHLIIFNHPGYDNSNLSGPWRLENAIVIQTSPKRLFQGHGIPPMTFGQMEKAMLRKFNRYLSRLRKRVKDHLQTNPSSTATIIDLVDPPTTFSTAEQNAFRQFIRQKKGRIKRLVSPALSDYKSIYHCADWWLEWDVKDVFSSRYELYALNKLEATGASELTAGKEHFWKKHRIKYSKVGGQWIAHMPLWEAVKKKNGDPVKNSAGKISRIRKIEVTSRMIESWSWFTPDPNLVLGGKDKIKHVFRTSVKVP